MSVSVPLTVLVWAKDGGAWNRRRVAENTLHTVFLGAFQSIRAFFQDVVFCRGVSCAELELRWLSCITLPQCTVLC